MVYGFEKYYEEKVHLILDGRGYDTINYSSDSNVSLDLTATIISETDKFLNLEDITCANLGILRKENDENPIKFKEGMINKYYIIGIFKK